MNLRTRMQRNRMNPHFFTLFVILGTWLLWPASPVGATVFDWDNFSGDSAFDTRINWNPHPSPPNVPGVGDTAIFDGQLGNLGIGINTVNVTSGTVIDMMQVIDTAVVDMTIGDGTTSSRFDLDQTSSDSLIIGDTLGDTATLNLLGGWLDTWMTTIGGQATFNVVGEGSYWDSTSVLVSGDTITNTAGIGLGNEATIRSNSLEVGSDTGSGRVVVDGTVTGFGTSSLWTVSGSVDIGPTSTTGFNFGDIALQDGGRMSVGSNVYVHGTSCVSSTLTVRTGGALDVTGSLNIGQGGMLELLGSQINTRSFIVDPNGTFTHDDGTLTVDGGTFDPGVSDYTLDGATPADLPVVKLFNGATASLSGTLVGIGILNRGRLEIRGGSQVDLPDLGSTLGLGGDPGSEGEIIVDGKGSSLTTQEGLVVGDSGRGVLRILNGGSVSDVNSPFETLAQSGGVGIVEVIGKAPDNTPSTWTSRGEIWVGQTGLGTLTITTGGQVHALAGASIAHSLGAAGSAATVIDLGSSWQITGSLYVGGWVAGAGDLGTLRVDNDGQVVATDTTVWLPGTIELDNGILSTGELQLEGRLVGNGSIVLGATGAVTNRGLVSPGLSAGVLTISGGDYVQDSNGIFEIEIGGTSPAQFDQLNVVSGAATLAGMLSVSLIDPTGGGNIFVPSAGDSFDILTASLGISGAFLPPSWPTLDPGLFWQLDNNGNVLSLWVVPALEADFDLDGDVDSVDLTIWEGAYGVSDGADADNDGDSDGADYIAWQRQFGSGVPAVATNAVVPEPATVVLLIAGLLALNGKVQKPRDSCNSLSLAKSRGSNSNRTEKDTLSTSGFLWM